MMKTLRFPTALLTLLLLAFAASAFAESAGGRPTFWTGNIQLYGGLSQANGALDYSLDDEFTGNKRDLDLSTPFVVGVQFDVNRQTGKVEKWPVHLLGALYGISVNKNNYTTAELAGNNFYTNTREVDLKLYELDLGARAYLFKPDDWFRPHFGVGAALLYADARTTSDGLLRHQDSETGDYTVVDSESTSVRDNGLLYGVWGSAGMTFILFKFLDLGLELRYLRTLGGSALETDLSSWNLGVLAGYHF